MASTFLHYDILKKIGEGGMGIVYLAQDTRLNRKVALKFLPKHIAKDPSKHEQILNEARAAAALNHRNVAQVHAVEEANGEFCIVLEYVEGEELQTEIQANTLTVDKKREIASEIAEGLKAAHDNGIIHRDIKSSNIMIDSSGGVKIMDFGLAQLEGSEDSTYGDTTVGTTAYMSPELMRGAEADARSDIWSFGVVLYELFTGELPFRGLHEAALMFSVTEEDPLPIDSQSTEVPEAIEQVIYRCLEKNPEDRYQSMSEVLEDVRKQEASETSPATVSSNRTVMLTVLAMVIVAITCLYLFFGTKSFEVFGNVPAKKYLAVLPIENLGNNPDMQSFCDALAETFSYRLSELEQYEDSYWVTPASEMRKENILSASQASRIFGVNLVISSSIQTFGDSTRLILELIDVDADNVRRLGTEQVTVHSDNLVLLEQEGIRAMLSMLRIDSPEIAENIKAESPNDPKAYEYYLKGRVSLQQDPNVEILEDAILNFEQALDLDPNFALAYAGLGESYLRMYELTRDVALVEEAKSSLNRAQSINKQLPPVQYLMGLIEDGAGNYEKAIGHFQNALEIDRNYNAALSGMADAYGNLGQEEKAVSIYERIIAQKPEYWVGYSNLGIYYLNKNKWDRAIENFNQVIELVPQNSGAYSNLGYAYFNKNDLEKAAQMFEKSLALEESVITASNLAIIYYRSKMYTKTADMYEIILENEQSQDRYEIWSGYATAVEWSEEREGEAELYKMAIEKAEEQLAVNPNDPVIISAIGTFYSDINNKEKALEYIERALKIDPENSRIRADAISTYENLGMREEALKWVRADVIRENEWIPDWQALVKDPNYIELKNELTNEDQ